MRVVLGSEISRPRGSGGDSCRKSLCLPPEPLYALGIGVWLMVAFLEQTDSETPDIACKTVGNAN